MHIIPQTLLSDERMWAHSCYLTPHRLRTGTTWWDAWRILWRVRERSRLSSPSQLWVAGSLSPYDVIIYLFCTELLLYSKDVTFVSVPLFIICVRLGPSTPGDYVRARVLVPQNPGVTEWRTPSPSHRWRRQRSWRRFTATTSSLVWCYLPHPDFRGPKPGHEIITNCAGTKSHTYDESWYRNECYNFTI